jgi:hypothetical protein
MHVFNVTYLLLSFIFIKMFTGWPRQNPSKSKQSYPLFPKAWYCFSNAQSNEEYEGYLRSKGFHRRGFMKKILSFITFHALLT